MEEEEETIIIAKNVPELSLISFNLIHDINEKSLLNLSDLSENNKLFEHIETYYKKHPLDPVTFKDVSLEWFNVEKSLSIEEDLSSHIVILDFFTYCCINCLHILPDLEAVEERYPPNNSPVAVVGVHSGKFDNEKLTSNVANAIQRHHITHPVANDFNCKLWTTLGIACWPTLLVLGPGGIPLFVLVGEGHSEMIIRILDESIKYFSNLGKLQPKYLPLMLSSYLPSLDSYLYFPGKVTSYTEGLIISDSGNNRVIITDFNGNIKTVIGCGKRSFKDGLFEEACFNNPQGVVYHPSNVIFVADTDNHAIRKINLSLGSVETIAGNGKQGTDIEGGGKLTEQPISSPWDLCLARSLDMVESESPPNMLLIAMSGSHQIWGIFLTSGHWLKNSFFVEGTVIRLAGSGLEENRNTSYPLKAGFSQPSGICLSTSSAGQIAFIADSESSSIRQFSLIDGAVKKLAGGGLDPTDLFSFGDIDGNEKEARFQHPLGITSHNDIIYVADSYNHKVKSIKKKDKKYLVETILGGKISNDCNNDENVTLLNEPGGICYCQERHSIFIADTNNSCIRELFLENNKSRKINLNFESHLDNSNDTVDSKNSSDTVDSKEEDVLLIELQPAYKNEVMLKFHLNLPSNIHLTPETKQKFQIISMNDNIHCLHREGSYNVENIAEVPVTVDQSTLHTESVLTVKSLLYICSNEGLCLIREFSKKVKFINNDNYSSNEYIYFVKDVEINVES